MAESLGSCVSTMVLGNGLINKLINIKKSAGTYRLTLSEFLLSTVEIKVHVQTLHELCDRVFVGVGLLKTHK